MKDSSTDLDLPVERTRPPAIPPAAPPYARDTTIRRPWGAYITVILLVLCALAGLGWWIATRPAPEGPRAGGRPPFPSRATTMPVVGAAVRTGEMPIRLNGLGTVTSLSTVTVRPQVAGPLMQVAFQEGQKVNKGDVLADIDPRPFQLALDQAQAQLMRDQALLRNAQVDLERYRTLVQQNSIAKQQRDTQEALVAQYQGTVKADQAQVDNARLNLSYAHIVAPVSGRVGLRQVDPGNYVQTSDANGLVVITQTQPISVLFTLPEDSLPGILKRLRAGASLPVTALDRGQSRVVATGTLTTVDNQIDTGTGTVKLRAQFANDDESLFPNQFVTVQLLVDTLTNVAVIPVSAIQRGAPGTFVYVIDTAENTVAVRPVTLGVGDGERVSVTKGLNPGEMIVVDGADKLRDGAKIALPGADGNAAPGAAAPREHRSNGNGGNGEGRRQRGENGERPQRPAQP